MAKGNPEEMPHLSDSNYRETRMFESACVCLFTRTLFPLNKHFTCLTNFCLFVGTYFYKARRPGTYHWTLVPGGLVDVIQCSHCHG